MAQDLNKIINYTKEAFLWPFHLMGMGILTVAAIATTLALPGFFNIDPAGLLLGFAGLELSFLGLITRSKRFRRAIATKYGNELRAYQYVQKLAEQYNELSAEGQRRFETFRQQLTLAKGNYSRLNKNFPELLNQYIGKIDGLQMNFMRLLVSYDRFPSILAADNPALIRRQIEEIRGSMGDDNEKLREIKEKRIALLQKRTRNYSQAIDNQKLIEQQLKTVEETMKYFVEQSLAGAGVEENGVIDGLLVETDDLNSTLNEIEAIYRSEISAPDTSNDLYQGSGSSLKV